MARRSGLRRAFAGLAFSALAVFVMAAEVRAQALPQQGEAVWRHLAGLGKAERLALLKQEAVREGAITVYGAIGIDRAHVFLDIFQKQYPGISVDFQRMTTNELPQKLMLEFGAHRTNADVVITTADYLEIIKPAIAAYLPTSWDEFDPRFRHGSVAEGWAALDYEALVEAIAWRTDRLKPGEAPKTLDEVGQPKWKGRTGTVTSLEHLVDSFVTLYGEAEGMKKIHALGALDNHLYPSIAGLSEALGAGDIDVAWGVSAQRSFRLKASGAPVDFVYEVPALAIDDAIMVTREAKHPYAAALLEEFLTDAKTMEMQDKLEPGRALGNLKGSYTKSLADFADLTIYRPIPLARYRQLNRIVEETFVRSK